MLGVLQTQDLFVANARLDGVAAAQFAVLVTCNHGNGAAACDAVAAACIELFRLPPK